MMRRACYPVLALLCLTIPAACGGGDGASPFGATSVVVVVNPPANEQNTAEVPAFVGTDVADVLVDADPGDEASTDITGLAVLGELSAGPTDLILDNGPVAALDIISSGDVYDVAVAYDGNQAGFYTGFPIRYGVGGEIVEIATEADATEALNTDDTIVFFEDGVHVGNLVIEGSNVTLFGEGFAEGSVVVDGDVEVRGGFVRIRGVTITGNLTVFGNNFGMSFSVVEGITQLNGQSISFLRNIFCQGATVPSSNAALFDNQGIAPFPAPGAPTCP